MDDSADVLHPGDRELSFNWDLCGPRVRQAMVSYGGRTAFTIKPSYGMYSSPLQSLPVSLQPGGGGGGVGGRGGVGVEGGKIQGDGRKFLDRRFKSYFGSQISSQSLNEVQICRLQPISATKGDFFSIYFCL